MHERKSEREARASTSGQVDLPKLAFSTLARLAAASQLAWMKGTDKRCKSDPPRTTQAALLLAPTQPHPAKSSKSPRSQPSSPSSPCPPSQSSSSCHSSICGTLVRDMSS